jgi:predicted ArsR family transcriptional regulator
MRNSPWRTRFFDTTRGRIVRLLCTAERTVTELATELGLTDNAVRSQLATLERDGWARQSGLRASTRKPNFAYELTPEGHKLFPKLEGPVLSELIGVLLRELDPRKVRSMLLEVAQRLLPDAAPAQGAKEARARLASLASALDEAGIPVEMENHTGYTIIRGCSCPLSAASAQHPQLCDAAATLLARTLDCPVTQSCQRDGEPRCIFRIAWK